MQRWLALACLVAAGCGPGEGDGALLCSSGDQFVLSWALQTRAGDPLSCDDRRVESIRFGITHAASGERREYLPVCRTLGFSFPAWAKGLHTVEVELLDARGQRVGASRHAFALDYPQERCHRFELNF